MKDAIQPQTYEKISNKETYAKAESKVELDTQGSMNKFISKSELSSADDTALGEALISKAIKENRINDANAISINLAEKLTKAGQTSSSS